MYFNPLPPHGGRPVMLASFGFLKPNFNPLPPHGGRRFCPGNGTGTVCISIHSLHTEGDQKYHILPSKNQLFQSTPSTRRETKLICRTHQRSSYFNPLPPHGGRLLKVRLNEMDVISIHSLHTEGDPCDHTKGSSEEHFNPLPPHGGRHLFRFPYSIRNQNFNPLPPHGGRRASSASLIAAMSFQSTPSTRRETLSDLPTIRGIAFQSTPSTRRETEFLHTIPAFCGHFNPLPPHGGRRSSICLDSLTTLFQSTPSTRRET